MECSSLLNNAVSHRVFQTGEFEVWFIKYLFAN